MFISRYYQEKNLRKLRGKPRKRYYDDELNHRIVAQSSLYYYNEQPIERKFYKRITESTDGLYRDEEELLMIRNSDNDE